MILDVDTLKRIATIACDAAIAAGAEFADVSTGFGKNLSVELDKNAIKSCDANLGGWITVRAIYKGGTGWSTSDAVTVDAAAEAGKNAARLALLAEPDTDFKTLAKPVEHYPQIEGLADPKLANLDVKEIIRFSVMNLDDALKVDPNVIAEGGFSSNYSSGAFVNSLGVSLGRSTSSIGGHIMSVVKRGEEVGSFYEFDSARMMSDFIPEGIGVKATEGAVRFLGARKIDTTRMPVILGPLASRSVLSSIAANADAEGIQRGRSFMMGKLGEKIGPDLLTLTDEPHIARGLSSRAYDTEGTPTRPITIVENGVLKTYLYSTYTAGKAGVEPTGHGTRGGAASPTNIVPKLGDMTVEEIIRSTPEGIYIEIGRISPNSTTGDVSSAVDFGFKIENGELAYPVASSMIGGSFLEMVKNIDAISSDYREEPGMIMPTIRIQDVLVAGGK